MDPAFLPLYVFKGAAVQARWTSDKSYPGTLYATSKNGWMEEPQFFTWFCTSFTPHVKKLRESKGLTNQTAVLLYDGHCSHISVRIVENALMENVKLVKFPSHLTDQIQPLDKCVFGPVKTKWDKLLVEYRKTQMGLSSGRITKAQFSELLKNVWMSGIIPANIISGFVSTGLCPVDATKFPEDEFDPALLRKYRKQKRLSDSATQTEDKDTTLHEPSTSSEPPKAIDHT
ncbi:hypothetical protein NQ314_013481 [Rhamnusium bicolor]|uniref:DDE-1 domain-containing protein n=1 Tax=Rhamnusium bicolor TaxID=1586634 RepID=A0AAV8X5Q8_9CUCU|nr:hypothetical protein NQ314_013481 [Rhamnusium bicolor]